MLFTLLAAVSVPALAQADPHAEHHGHHGHHDQHGQHERHEPPDPDPHAAHRAEQQDPHAGHHPREADPHAHHRPAEPDPHAAHGAQAQDPHAGHRMPGTEPAMPPAGPPPPSALSGPDHAADALFDPAAMAAAREQLRREQGAMTAYKVMIDRLEWRSGGGRDFYEWDVNAWIGRDLGRFWFKSSGEGAFDGHFEGAELQALYSRPIGPFFDLQGGVRQDVGPGPDRTHLAIGVQGLAPYWFEVEAFAFLSTKGDITARIEAEYDQYITQRLILQPRIEADFSLQRVPEIGLGAGLTSAEAGLRLRYEIVPEFAPYVGLVHERRFGGTADFARAAGEDVGGWRLVAGLRAWF
jgi:copper resistance protein B